MNNENNKPAPRPPAGNSNNLPRNNRDDRNNRNGGKPNNGNNRNGNNKKQGLSLKGSDTSRGQAIRASRRNNEMADKLMDGANLANGHGPKRRANLLPIKDEDKLRVVFLGGMDGIGEKNMIVIEYGNDAIITDCGNELGLDLPGINYAIPEHGYLEKIKHKIRGYVISHGHLDHVGGLPHILPKYPAPVYGSLFTIGMVKKALGNNPNSADLVESHEFVEMNMDNHERLMLGKSFTVELVRITHSIPECSLISIDTPLGRIINTGDFRLDPEPLDKRPSDLERLKELGKEGVLLLMSDSTNAQRIGRTPTEHTLQQSFNDIVRQAPGRIFVASFSSNLNRIQMIINSSHEAGRKVAIDGRSMVQHIELAVRLGLLKVPANTIVTIAQLANLPDDKALLICTGGQGEIGAAMQRMSIGEHRFIKLKAGDTAVISSTPIPGNYIAYDKLGDDLTKLGVRQFRAPTWEVDGSPGPLHVSGHAFRGEQKDMIDMLKPKYFAPIYAGALNRMRNQDVAIQDAGMSRDHTFLANNGDALEVNDKREMKLISEAVDSGSILVDDSGQIVPNVVVKDRLLLSETGLVVVVLTVDRKTGSLMSSPDIITRGFIYIRDNEELMNLFRGELRRAVGQRYKRVDLDRFKAELKDHITHFLYDQTQRSPIVIPVVNVVGGRKNQEGKEQKADQNDVVDQQKRFAELRAAIRTQDQPD